ncbi:lipid-A-disaccharide synthase [Blastopirellula sp. JC732]|uniref:Lipid-A-disaccharide synthase n=1 Tax=Blastopirellula sediminis TaxID=2894196 RepID=A0A9X1MSA1_9BACT|nr:lipid-A-disaccharide synthase [Blastopirellula sediminis]MCC9605992.1 lipid-A-disaccharide synthase [Blastopirellula sediminis]MCC9630709.1 lipid-A-disaccharide synthase [Blastopirellula sediminis]
MKIFFSVGEPSGDLHGANLIRALKARRSDLELVGYGGPKMAEAGCQLHADLTKLAIMWFLRVFLNLHRFIGLMLQANRYFRESRPDAVVLIDYPGFNWWIAGRAKAHGIPVFYYGTPQLWAWGGWRVQKMRKFVDHVLCKLPFEEEWYRQRDCNATFVGHPYFDQLRQHRLHDGFLADQREKAGKLVVILPGSRSQEVAANLPPFLETAKKIADQVPDVRFAVAAYNENQAAYAFERIIASGLDIEVQVDRTPELIHSAHCCLACSGSVSLELLYHEKPTVIHYKISPFALWVQSFFRKVRYITLVNILSTDQPFYDEEYYTYDPDALNAEQVLFPEYLTCEDRTGDMATRIANWLQDDPAYAARVQELHKLREKVAGGGASVRGAEYILSKLAGESVVATKRAA